VWVLHANYGVPGKEVSFIALGFTVFAALSMVNNIHYHSFKHLNVKDRVSFMVVIAVVLIFVLISLDPPQVLFMIFLGYSLSGPLFASVRLYQRRRSNRKRRTQAPRRL
jgi:CDP-diacylglycerol--serine O-phosphatidyltransferase